MTKKPDEKKKGGKAPTLIISIFKDINVNLLFFFLNDVKAPSNPLNYVVV
jgi:hypothetical protein